MHQLDVPVAALLKIKSLQCQTLAMGEVKQKKGHNKLASSEANTVKHDAVNTKTAPVDTIQLDTNNHTVLSTLNSLHNVLKTFYIKLYIMIHTVS